MLWTDDIPERVVRTVLFARSAVASAITLPPFRKPSRLSIRSGIVKKAKEPMLAIARGSAIRRSFGEGLKNEVAFDADAFTWPIFEMRKEGDEVGNVVPAVTSAGRSGRIEGVEDMVALHR